MLLFVPLGFGLAAQLRERGKSTRRVLVAALAAGAALSYTIEFFQLYIPERDSGWEDVFTNASGSVMGAILYFLGGILFFRALTATQYYFAKRLRMRPLVIAVLAYLCVWIGLAALLQKQTRLSGWNPNAMLVLGNDASGHEPWRGQIRTLQIWDCPASAISPASTPLVDYNFSTPLDLGSGSRFVPNLVWIPRTPLQAITEGGLALNGKSWISTTTAAENLIYKLQQTNQFTIHIVLTPENTTAAFGGIISISDSSGAANLTVYQARNNIAFWFRTPLSMKRAQLEWRVPPSGETLQRDLIYSYDGANLFITVDGKKLALAFPLGPGALMAQNIRRIRPSELEGYSYTFYAFVFFVSGAMVGLLRPRGDTEITPHTFVAIILALLAMAFLLEFVLVCVSGRSMSFSHVELSFVLGIAGYLWAETDGPFVVRRRSM